MPKKPRKLVPKANGSLMLHGNTKNGTNVSRLLLSQMPKTMRRQMANARKYREGIEQLVYDKYGEITATQAHLINEATQAEVHASICAKLLKDRMDKMSVADITKCSEQMMKAKSTRNKAIKELNLDAEVVDPFANAFDGTIKDAN